MVEIWEIEWNSSMMEHGRDAGTMEYIFAKGGTLRDFNYVLLNQNDDTWEPLIKAVAERDNSHPDIIRKQAPYGVTQDFRAAQPYAGTAVQSPRQARRQYKTQQTMQGLDNYEQNPSARNAMQAGLYGAAAGHAAANTGRALMSGASKAGSGMAAGAQRAGSGMAAGAGKAKDFMSRKFPGVRQRMGNFVQGVGDTARHGMDALLGEKDEKGKRVGDGVLARTVKRRGDQNQLDRLQTQSYFDQPSNEEEKAKLQADIDEAGPSSGFSGLRNEIRRLGDARRGARTVDPAVAAAGELAEEQMEDGPVDSALTDQPPIEENPLIEEDPMPSNTIIEEDPMPSTAPPPPEAGQPQASPAALKPQEVYDQQIASQYGEGEKPYGSRSRQRQMGSALQSGSYEAGAFPNTPQGKQAMDVLERMGVPRPEAAKTAAAAEKGDPQAKKIVEDAESSNALVEDEPMPNSLMVNDAMALSEDNIDTRGWNLLMKQLAIR